MDLGDITAKNFGTVASQVSRTLKVNPYPHMENQQTHMAHFNY